MRYSEKVPFRTSLQHVKLRCPARSCHRSSAECLLNGNWYEGLVNRNCCELKYKSFLVSNIFPVELAFCCLWSCLASFFVNSKTIWISKKYTMKSKVILIQQFFWMRHVGVEHEQHNFYTIKKYQPV